MGQSKEKNRSVDILHKNINPKTQSRNTSHIDTPELQIRRTINMKTSMRLYCDITHLRRH